MIINEENIAVDGLFGNHISRSYNDATSGKHAERSVAGNHFVPQREFHIKYSFTVIGGAQTKVAGRASEFLVCFRISSPKCKGGKLVDFWFYMNSFGSWPVHPVQPLMHTVENMYLFVGCIILSREKLPKIRVKIVKSFSPGIHETYFNYLVVLQKQR